MVQRSKGKVTLSKPGWIAAAGFIISFIFAVAFTDPSKDIETNNAALNEQQTVEEIAPETDQEETTEPAEEVATETETDEEQTTSPSNTTSAGGELTVHFIDVGQGDSTLIVAPNGKTMLVDGGPKSAGDDVVSYLNSKGISKLDYVVATHPDADHIGGLIDVLNSIQVGQLIDSGKAHTTETYSDLLSLVDSKNINYIVPSTGDTFPLDSILKTNVLYANDDASDNNDASIVLQFIYNKVSFLLMGDADTGIESSIVSNNNVAATVLKAGHHGSDTSSSASFLNEVQPEVAILSYGKDNSYGHPDGSVVNRLTNLGAEVYRTPFHCNITVSTNGVTYDVNTSCDRPVPSPSETAEKPAASPPATQPKTTQPATPPATQGQTNFKNCTELRKVYPAGVSENDPAYQSKMDRDKDGWACE